MTSNPNSNAAANLPRVHVAPDCDESFGDLAAKLSGDYGLVPDDWQKRVLDDWLARAGGRWASLTCGLSVPRQNGKNALIEMRELFGAVGLGEKILHTAHEVKTAQKHFRRLLSFFGQRANDPAAPYPELNALVQTIRRVNGQEAILLTNGGSIEVVARSKSSGRGFTVDLLVLDEAQELADDALEALMPTTSAAPLGDPQWIFTGTPPGPQADGDVFTRVRADALGETPGRVCWSEWSITRGTDVTNETNWRATNPAVDAGRLSLEVIRGEFARFSPDGFARERLGQWPVEKRSHALISSSEWGRLADNTPPAEGKRVFGVKFSVDGAWVALAGAVNPGNSNPVTVGGLRVAPTAEGIDWVVEFLATRKDRIAQVVIDGRDGRAALVAALAEAGVRARPKAKPAAQRVRIPSLNDYIDAHSRFYRAVVDEDLLHDDNPVLNEQVAHARKRQVGNQGGWGWQGIGEADDVTLLDAVTLAFWGAVTTTRREQTPGKVRVM